MPKKIKPKDCPHPEGNTTLKVVEVYCTCEVVDVVCGDCGKVLKTTTDC